MRRDLAALLLVPMLTFLPVTGALLPAAVTEPLDGLLPADAAEPTPPMYVGHRLFVLVMIGHTFNFQPWPNSPLLEAYVGETLQFVVHVPQVAEMHTFHLHGHPWLDALGTGQVIDTVLLEAGESHVFDVVAGLGEGHDGDWFYHCHVDTHFDGGMWGLLRVYPFGMDVRGDLAQALEVRLDRRGAPVEGATFTATLDGVEVPVAMRERGAGAYEVRPAVPEGAGGALVLAAHHAELGLSVARLALDGTGAHEVVRDVAPPGAVELLPEDIQAQVPALAWRGPPAGA